MTKEQAQQIIRSVIDQAIKAGVLQNIDAAATVAQAWGIIINELKKDESADA
jgi:hypothetical protein